MTKLQIKSLSKSYADNLIMSDVNLTVNDGEFVVFVGPSGCGKSTLLRMIAGLETITAGSISLNGKCLNKVSPSDRKVAMVFQSYALYPHMNVAKNIGFPLKMAGIKKRTISERVAKTAKNLQLDNYLDRLPGELSGGQRQRVAIGRAIVREPELFLFDEPLSNLDAKLRGEMRMYLKQLHQKLRSTMIYVTHDQVEAMTLADRVVVLNQGNIEQVDSPEVLYDKPVNKFVAAFIGAPVINFLEGSLENCNFNLQNLNNDKEQFLSLPGLPINTCSIGIRPNQVVIDSHNFDVLMKVKVVEPLGHSRLYYGEVSGQPFTIDSTQRFKQGDSIPISLIQSVKHCFNKDELRIEVEQEIQDAA